MADGAHEKNIFPFFDLPRELRDMVYGYITTNPLPITICYPNEQRALDQGVVKMSLSHTLDPKVLCISRRIKHEYEQIMSAQELLTFADHSDFDFQEEPGTQFRDFPNKNRLRRTVKRAQFLGVLRHRQCLSGVCDASGDAAEAAWWLDYTLSYFHAITTIEVTLAMQWPSTGHPCLKPNIEASGLKRELDRIVAMQQVTALHVHKFNSKKEEVPEKESRGPLLISWTKQDGWQSSKAAA